MSKLSFKRISLALVASLGFGVLSITPAAQAATIDETLTLSASTASVLVGETATVTATITMISDSATPLSTTPDSRVVYVSGTSAGGSVFASFTSDSANARTLSGTAFATSNGALMRERSVTTTPASPSPADSFAAVTADAYTKVVLTLKFYQVATPGTYVYTISTRKQSDGSAQKTATFTLTVTSETASAAKSLTFLNRPAEFGAGVEGVRADSALVVSAGTAASPAAVAVLWPELRNASDTKVTTSSATGNRVWDSVTVTISGPGLLAGHINGIVQTRAKQVTIASYDTIIVYSDGTAGTATITSYVGTSATASKVLAQAAKTIKFNGAATTITPKAVAAVVAGGNLSYSDSTTSGTAIITFLPKDAASNVVVSGALQTGGQSSFYAISSDSKVISGRSLRNYEECSYTSQTVGWTCNMFVVDSGTATITIYDSTTVNGPTASVATSYTVAGAAWTGTIAFDKTTYAPGEVAILTVTAKDLAGRNVANGEQNPFTLTTGNKAFSAAGTTSGGTAAGFGSSGAGTTFTMTGSSFVNGVDTYVVGMPNYAGPVTISGFTSYESSTVNTAVLVTATVVDPNAAGIAASQAAADAATDAAAEAIDAANAATDAANLAAEAADAATVAAEEARDAADAATAAVEELATQVATLMAALKAQITTLANTVAKIAKKVKA